MTLPPHFDQKGQSVDTQTNIGHADKVIIQASSSASGLPIPHQIRPPPRDFTGREDDIKGLLEQFGQGATITGLRGMGGIGKTALALLLAERLAGDYSDGQILVEMKGTDKNPLSWAEAMIQIIHAYEPEFKMPMNEGELQGKYFSVLHEKKALLLLDNTASREQVEPIIPPRSCALLITSRKKFALPGLAEKDLDVLHMEDARKLLLEICSRIGEHAGELAEICGRLPIALRNAASILRERSNMSVANYIERLGDAKKRLELVDASFSTSYELLTPELQRLWSMLSVFPADFDLAGAAAVWEMERMPSEDALGDLIRWSLVDFLPSATEEAGRYRLHDIARYFAESRLEEAADEAARLRHSEHYINVLSLAEEYFLKGNEWILKGLQLFDKEKTNIFAGHSWAVKGLEGNHSAAIDLCESYPNAGVNVLDLRLSPDEKKRWLETALEACRKSDDRVAEEAHLGNLGSAYLNLGKPLKAIEFHEQALAISKEIGDRQGEGNHLGNLGNAYLNLGESRKAIEFYKEVLKISRELGDRRGEGAVLGNLGVAYYRLGKPRKAIEFYEQALKISREIGNRRGEGDHLSNLGNARLDLGKPLKAIEFYKQALAISKEIGDRRSEGDHLGNLGVAYYRLGEPRKAIEFYEQALAISKEIGDRRSEGDRLSNLGVAYSDLGESRKAIEFHEQALKISREISDRRGEGDRLGNLGLAYYHLGKTRKAIEFYEQALKISREIGNRRGEGAVLGNLGLAYYHLGKTRKAIEFYEQALKISREIGNRRGEGADLYNLGLAYYHLNEYRKAVEFYEQALKISREIGDRRDEGADLGKLGWAFYHLGETRKAIEFYEQALKISREIGDRRGEGNHLLCMSLSLQTLGQQEKAISLAKSALAIYEQLESPHAETVRKILAVWAA